MPRGKAHLGLLESGRRRAAGKTGSQKGDARYMKMALRLAGRGKGLVSPNPMVGAVVVKNGKVVGRGWHKYHGGRHAEPEALRDAGRKARGADLYVTLEPCNHYGKRPPCTKAILRTGIKRVFAAKEDPNRVSKRGAKFLQKHGVRVYFGLCAAEAEKQNEFYIKSLRLGRPFITIKIAITEKGFITYGDRRRKMISGSKAFGLAQKLREEHDAVVVGLGTILNDDPRLTVRGKPQLNPVRVVLDSKARTPLGSMALREKGETIIACTSSALKENTRALKAKGAEIITAGKGRRVDLKALMKRLYAQGISSVLVEPGHETATSFLGKNFFDRIIIIVGRRNIKDGLEAFRLARRIKVRIKERKKIGNDLMIVLEK